MKLFFRVGKIFFQYINYSSETRRGFFLGLFFSTIDILLVTILLPYSFTYLVKFYEKDAFLGSFAFLVNFYLFFNFIKSIIQPIIDWSFYPVINMAIKNITQDLVLKLHRMPYYQIRSYSTPELISLIRRIPFSVRIYLRVFFQQLIPLILKIVIILFTIYSYGFILMPTLVALFFGPILYYKFSRNYLLTRFKGWRMNEKTAGILTDSLVNTFFVRRNLRFEEKRLDSWLSKEANVWQTFANQLVKTQVLVNSFVTSCILIALSFVFYQPYILSQVIFLKRQLTALVLPLMQLLTEIRLSTDSAIDMKAIVDLYEAKELDENISTQEQEEFIDVKNISFSYSHYEVFKNFSLKIHQGDKIAVTGPMGVGKSTLLTLIAGFEQVKKGQIIYQKNIYDKIVFLPQQSFLFNGTLEDNLFYGFDFINKKKFLDLFHLFGMNDMTQDDSFSLQRPIGEFGKNLSGGQRQKIALVRALLFEPKILLLDESTCFLDEVMEKKVFEFLTHENITLIFTTHNLKLLSYANKVFNLERVQKKGLYV